MSFLQNAKTFLMLNLHLGKDALHIYVGLAVFLASAAVFRWPIRSWRPWIAALCAALAGEIWDLRDTFTFGGTLRLEANLKDVLNTIFWPTMLMLLARWTKILKR